MRCLLILLAFMQIATATCKGKFLNPITDVCWKCLFPITIGGLKVTPRGEDTSNPRQIICMCRRGGIGPKLPGIPVSFWEPARLVDVTRTPYCLIGMGGIKIGSKKSHGSVAPTNSRAGLKHSFYHAHYYVYPVIYWLKLFTDFICLEKTSIDVAYMSEIDPTWGDDSLTTIINPEAILFGNPLAQAACAADCVAASAGFSQNILFWCAGCQGGLYPFNGSVPAHVGGVQASLLVVQKLIAKMHRMFLAWRTSGKEALCKKCVAPVIVKNQYKTQMIYPRVKNSCHPLGRTETVWSAGTEAPYKGEDFVYLLWRKRNCCVF